MSKNDHDGLAMPKTEELGLESYTLLRGRGKIITVAPESIPFHPALQMYNERTEEEEEGFRQNIMANGLLQRPGLNSEGALVIGGRRVKAAVALGIPTIEVEILDVAEEDTPMLIVQSNTHREKTHLEQYRELKVRKAFIAKRKGQRTDLDTTLTAEEKMHTDDRLANEMGISSTKVSRLEKVGDTNEELLKLVDTQDDVNLTEVYKACCPQKPKNEKESEEIDLNDIKQCPYCGSHPKRIIKTSDGRLSFVEEGGSHE